jgi:hypothetical protein
MEVSLQMNMDIVVDVREMTSNVHWLYHSFIPYTGCYMFRQ